MMNWKTVNVPWAEKLAKTFHQKSCQFVILVDEPQVRAILARDEGDRRDQDAGGDSKHGSRAEWWSTEATGVLCAVLLELWAEPDMFRFNRSL